MKTTVEIPDSLLRRAKASAARKGQTMGAFINSAIVAKLKTDTEVGQEKTWMRFAGIFREHRDDSRRVMRAIEKECERIDMREWE